MLPVKYIFFFNFLRMSCYPLVYFAVLFWKVRIQCLVNSRSAVGLCIFVFFFSGSGLSANHSSIPRPTSRTGATAKEEKFTHLAPRSFIISLINGTSRQRLEIGSAWIGKKGMGTRSFWSMWPWRALHVKRGLDLSACVEPWKPCFSLSGTLRGQKCLYRILTKININSQ